MKLSCLFFMTLLLAGGSTSSEEGHDHQIHLAGWNWEHVGIYLTIILFVLLSGLAKVVFHKLHWLSSRVPESCLLVVVGTIFGAILKATKGDGDNSIDNHYIPEFTPDLFFFALLPPIILESAYTLYDATFFDQLPTILLLAVVGTTINFLLIGFLLYGVSQLGALGTIRGLLDNPDETYELGLFEILLFAALISAVDPVAVLAIFQEVAVNDSLYFLVFGESLLNDGVAVVFYKTMSTFTAMENDHIHIGVEQYIMGVVSFFTIALGGLFVGILVGLISALITRTTQDVRVIEPLALIGTAYLAYFGAELFHWSGIISLIGCGLIQAHYSFKNVSKKSKTTVTYFVKMASATSDIIIFLFLGTKLVNEPHRWHTGFFIWTICFCLICRFISTYGLMLLANRNRITKINVQEQFIMAYGGLRGAVGFSLVEMISENVKPRRMFVTTTLSVTMFTIFFQGMTIKFLVNLLRIDRKKDEQKRIAEEVNDNLIEHIMSGINLISGQKGRIYLHTILEKFDEKYMMPIFCNACAKYDDLTRLFEKLAVSDHILNLYGPSLVHSEGKTGMLLKPVKSTDLLLDENTIGSESPTAHHRLLDQPPPLPPKQSIINNFKSSNLVSSFRRRGRSDATEMTPRDPVLRRSSQRDDIHLLRSAFNAHQSIYRGKHRLGRHQLDDTDNADQEDAFYNQLKMRHVKAKRISLMMLKKQIYLEDDSHHQNHDPAFGRSRHLSLLRGKEEEDHRLGMEAVLRLYQERRAAVNDPTYSNVNEIRRSNQMAENQEVPEVETTKSSIGASAVERKKNAPSGRRKLTPHPLNPNNASAVEESPSSSGAEKKLAVLEEDENKSEDL